MGKMDSAYQRVDIWVGRFSSETELDEYLSDSEEIADYGPRSRFAAEQNQLFVDHDFIEASFHSTDCDFLDLIEGHSFAQSYLDLANAAFMAAGLAKANALILAFGEEIQVPRSVATPDYSLWYLGRFECDPKDVAADFGSGTIPIQVNLLVKGSVGVAFNGNTVLSIPIDARGLVIGSDGPVSDMPRLDISAHVEGVAVDQLKIYQDQFEQWIIQDLAGNGLTRLDGEDLSHARTFPWHGKRLSIGNLELEWSVA